VKTPDVIRHWKNRTTKTCSYCGASYRMGRGGVESGCDACLGIERDRKGRAWLSDETEQVFEGEGGGEIVITRAEAFEGGRT
jgi:hypothetical protein